MELGYPLVSVIIPTFKRPHLVGRAVQSALKQTLGAIEVIVVMDGPDEATLQMLETIRDPRLQVRTLCQHGGASDARNAGVTEARSRWIAFLDDDDEWFPQKLEVQLRTAQGSHHLHPIILCRVVARTQSEEFVWPQFTLRAGETLSEYLFCLKSLKRPLFGKGLIQTSMILTTKELLQTLPFTCNLARHLDTDWVLRACKQKGVSIEFVSEPKPLVIWHIESSGGRISTHHDWRFSFSWGQTNRHLMTPRAFASFLMIEVSGHAAEAGDWRAFWPLLREACRHGKPNITDLLAYLIICLIPPSVRRQTFNFFCRIFHLGRLKHTEWVDCQGREEK